MSTYVEMGANEIVLGPDDEVAAMQLGIALILSGSAIYAIVHLAGWTGLAIAWLLCGLSSGVTMELYLPEGTDSESKKERGEEVYVGAILSLCFGVVATIILFYMWVAGCLRIANPKKEAHSEDK